MLLRLASRNVFRHKVRTSMTLAAIIFGVSGLILSGGFVKDIFVQLGEAIIHSQTGHIQIFHNDFLERGTRQPERYLIKDSDDLTIQIARLPEISDVAARLNFSGLLNNGRRDLPIIGEGIEPAKEARIGSYLRVIEGRHLEDSDSFGLMVGQGVAQSLGLSAGDNVALVMNTADGALNTLDFEVIGVFQSFSKDFDARAIRIPLAAARELMAVNGANLIVITLTKTDNTNATLDAVRLLLPDGLESRSWRQISDFYDKAVQLYDRQFGFLQLIILFMVLLSVANTVNMGISERLAEFGTMQALGNKRRQVFRLVVLENMVLGIGGAFLGIAFGVGLALVISAVGIPMPPPPNANIGYTALIRVDLSTVLTAFVIGALATILAALLPARRASTIAVVDALRQRI